MRLERRSPCKHNRESNRRYNLRIRISMPSPHASQTSPPTRTIQPASNHLHSTSILSTSSLSSAFPTPPSSPSAPIPPVQSYPLEREIKTTHSNIANLAEFLANEIGTCCKERDEMTLEAERLREVAARHSSEATRLQTIRDTLRRTWEESIICGMCREPCTCPYLIQECMHMFCLECLQQWFTECLRKDLEYVDLPTYLEAQRDPPYSAQTLEEFYASGYIGLSFTCPCCHGRVWEKPKEEQVLTSVIASLAAAFGTAMQTDTNDVDRDVWAGIFVRHNE